VSAPLIPYLTLPELPLSFLQHVPLLGQLIDPREPPSIKPFGTLVALGVYLGTNQALKRAKERGYDMRAFGDYLLWAVGTGFVLSHVLDALTYHPETVLRDPLYLIKIWDGLSSYGGFIGAVVGSLAFKWYRGQKNVLGFIDVTVSGMPLAWVFGRTGCSVVHDHPGILSNAWYAVQYPVRGGGYVGRLDLGLIEMVLTIPLAITVWVLWRRRPKRPDGYYTAVIGILYSPIRFGLDFLRIGPKDTVLGADQRYLGLTPAQYASFLLFGAGLFFFFKIRRDERARALAAVSPASAAPTSAPAQLLASEGDAAQAREVLPAESAGDAAQAKDPPAAESEPADGNGTSAA
jgi:phosphatidylglycerol---prolipoprotein diacylglyceryl transferase